jgi:replicative superfamily II helicase
VKVILLCSYDEGNGKVTKPNTPKELDKNEAVRLIRMRLAKPLDVRAEVDSLIPEDESEGSENKIPLLEKVVSELKKIPGVDESLAAGLYNEEIYSIEEIASMKNTEIISSFEGITKKMAKEIISSAKAILGK